MELFIMQIMSLLQVHSTALPVWIQSCHSTDQEPVPWLHCRFHIEIWDRRRRHIARWPWPSTHRIWNRWQWSYPRAYQTVHIFRSGLGLIIVHGHHSQGVQSLRSRNFLRQHSRAAAWVPQRKRRYCIRKWRFGIRVSVGESSTIRVRLVRRLFASTDATRLQFQWIGHHYNNNDEHAILGEIPGGREGLPATVAGFFRGENGVGVAGKVQRWWRRETRVQRCRRRYVDSVLSLLYKTFFRKKKSKGHKNVVV